MLQKPDPGKWIRRWNECKNKGVRRYRVHYSTAAGL